MSGLAIDRSNIVARIGDRRRIAIVNSIVNRFDAISASVRDMAMSLMALGHEVLVFCYHSDFDDIPVRLIRDNADLILDEFFSAADLLVWHFGIHSESFNSVMFGNGRAPRVICFHNVTPEQFVPEASRPLIRRSIAQTHLLPFAEEIWAVSDVNAQAAIDCGVPCNRIITLPIQVDLPALSPLAAKRKGKIEMLYVGRFAKAKGVLDLLESFRNALAAGAPISRLTLAGNVNFSDPEYSREIKDFICGQDLETKVKVVENIDDDGLFRLYRRAHLLGIASYHEGFCKPVIEALRAGCIPVGYEAYNIPFVCHGFGALVPVGDVAGLSSRIVMISRALVEARDPASSQLPLDRGATSIAEFDKEVALYVKRYEGRAIADKMAKRVGALIDAHCARIEERLQGAHHRR